MDCDGLHVGNGMASKLCFLVVVQKTRS